MGERTRLDRAGGQPETYDLIPSMCCARGASHPLHACRRMGTGCDSPTIGRNPNVLRSFTVIVIIIDMIGTKKICNQEFNVENEDFLPGTPFPENPSQPPNFAHFCGQRGIPTWYLYILCRPQKQCSVFN